MAKILTFRVINGRVQFKCPFCQKRRNVVIAPTVRKRSIRCHQCDEMTRCNFNRREILREQQTGKVLLTTSDGREMVAHLFDISTRGVGFDVAFRDTKKITMGKELKFHCSWNSRLFSRGRYVVRAITGQRVGAQNII